MRWGHSWPHFRSIFFGNLVTAPEANVIGSMQFDHSEEYQENGSHSVLCTSLLSCHPGYRANAGHTPATLVHLPTRSLALTPALVGLGSTKVSSLDALISSWNLVKRYLVPRSTHEWGRGRMPSKGFLVVSKFLLFIQITLLNEN